MRWARFVGAALAIVLPSVAAADPLILDYEIPLPETRGRIDHLAIDLKRQRLLVAELGNDTVDVVDLGRAAPQDE